MSRRERGRPRPRPSVREPYAEIRQRSADRRSGASGAGRSVDLPGEVDGRILLGILPLRFFLGLTFLYAGLDKLIDPSFLHSSGVGSIASQLEAFSRDSPLAFLIDAVARPAPVLMGWLISIAEIAIGIGALLGLAFRFAATGGALLAFMFWLTASWATKPYYYGPDLPYAFGWLTLALVGHGGRFALESRFAGWIAGQLDPYGDEPVTERRAALQVIAVGLATVAVAGLGRAFGPSIFRPAATDAGLGDLTGAGSSPSPGPVDGSPDPGQTVPPGDTPAPTQVSGTAIAKVSQLTTRHAVEFTIPQTGDPGIVIKLGNGKIVAYDSTCTHAGCPVQFDPGSALLICPCHGATFDPANDAQVLGGPTDTPLTRLPIKIDTATGRVMLQG